MPSKSKKQHSFMQAVANNPKFAKRVGVKPSVGKDFASEDRKMKKYQAGGTVKIDLDRARADTEARDKMRAKMAAARREAASDALQEGAVRRGNRMQAEEAGESRVMRKRYAAGGKIKRDGCAVRGMTQGRVY